jgi:hypothetical protein
MTTTIRKAILSFNAHIKNSMNHAPFLRGLVLTPLVLICLAFSPAVQATPEGGPPAPRATREAPAGPEIPEGAPTAPQAPLPGFNTADGTNALGSLTTGSGNSAFGWFSLFSATDASFNTGFGAGTLLSNVSGNSNTAVGTAALLFNTSNNDTACGAGALTNNTTGFENTAVGVQALTNSTTAGDNTAVGLFALLTNVNGSSNTAVGAAALRDNVSGSDNQAFGRGALRNATGSNNIAIGREAGTNMTTASNVISIGSPGDGSAFATGDRCFIGNIRGVTVGNADGLSVIIDSDGQLGTINSSRRFKKDIKPIDQTSEAILALKPVTFHYKNQDTKRAENTPQFGLIAEDVAEVNPDLVVRDADGKPFTVRYDAVNAMLLNEFHKEHRKVQQLEGTLASLVATVKEQAAQIQKVSAQLELSNPAPRTVLNNH